MNDQEILLEILDRVKKVERHLYNDDDTGKDGLVKSHDKLDTRVSILEEQNTIRKAKATTWGGIGGVIIILIYKALEFIYKIIT